MRVALLGRGWVDGDPWTPLTLDLGLGVDGTRIDATGLRVRTAEVRDVDDWTAVHWSAFKGTAMDERQRADIRARWTTVMTGPFATSAHSLIGQDAEGTPVAVTTVWMAGEDRPGLVEPMGVHRGHRGRGFGTAITLAGALALQRAGASAAVLAAEDSNAGAVATYRAAGFTSTGSVHDLVRPAS